MSGICHAFAAKHASHRTLGRPPRIPQHVTQRRSATSAFKPSSKGQHLPHFTGTLGMIFFISRARHVVRRDDAWLPRGSPEPRPRTSQVGTIIPATKALWIKHFARLARKRRNPALPSSAIRRERQGRMRAWLIVTTARSGACVFCLGADPVARFAHPRARFSRNACLPSTARREPERRQSTWL